MKRIKDFLPYTILQFCTRAGSTMSIVSNRRTLVHRGYNSLPEVATTIQVATKERICNTDSTDTKKRSRDIDLSATKKKKSRQGSKSL